MPMIPPKRASHRQRWTEVADSELRRHIESGLLLPQIAMEMARSQEAVRTRANVLKLPVRSSHRGSPAA